MFKIKRMNKRMSKKTMRSITLWLAILNIVFLFGIVSSASALVLPKFQSDTTNPMVYVGGNNGVTYVAGKVYAGVYSGVYNNLTDYSSPSIETPTDVTTFETLLTNKMGGTGGRIHGGYTANTDACAACHVAHTAVGQTSLLQWIDSLSTCMACHDGTVTITYDVNAGAHDGIPSSAGKFGFSDNANRGHSAHAVNAVDTNVAPGGNIGSVTADVYGTWGDGDGVQFTCVSCHAPHGDGGNARLISPDSNGLATQRQNVFAFAFAKAGGIDNNPAKIVAESVYALLMTADTDPKVYYDSHSGAQKNWLNGSSKTQVWAYDSAGAGTATQMTYLLDYTIDSKNGNIQFKVDPLNNPKYSGITQIYASYVPAIVVNITVTGKLTNLETVTYVSGMNDFCTSCHTDYNASSEGFTGVYTTAPRHRVGIDFVDHENGLRGESGLITCLTCHWAHGTDDHFSYSVYQIVYNTTYNGPILPENEMQTTDLTRSSALKRIPNMGVCESCHLMGYASLPSH